MKLHTFTDPNKYLAHVQPFLEQNEAMHSLPLGLLLRLVKKQSEGESIGFPVLMTVEESGDIKLCIIQTPPHNFILASNENTSEETVNFAAMELHKNHYLPGVLGEKSLVNYFSAKYCELSSCRRKLRMDQRIYRLDKVNQTRPAGGYLRKADRNDLPLLKKWIQDFSYSMGEPLSEEDCQEKAKQFVNEESAVLWENSGQVVSMANETRPTRNGTTINFVYTPLEQERKGYASACVAAFSQQLLDRGYRYCSLYTDLSNPTSNSIYMKIGYQPIGDSIVYSFED